MTKQEAKKRAEKLRAKIDDLRYRYHVLDDPRISDEVYDSLTRELREIEKQFPELITKDSPTQRVSGKALDKFKKVKHEQRMLSLNDAFSFEELKNWEERIKKLLPVNYKLDYFAEVKLDGLAVALIYENGLFKTGATRGDGITGEDVTQNLKTIYSIPLKLRTNKPPIRFEVRGEVYIKKKDFEKLNKEQEKINQPIFANPRNAAAGSVRQLDPKIAGARKLSFYTYDVVTDMGQKTHEQSHKLAKEFGLPVAPHSQHCKDLKAIENFYKKIDKLRDKLPYQIDGIVINVNNIETYKRLGVVGKAPRGSLAYKFQAVKATTQILDIKLQVGRTGALTPVAIMKPVQVAGSTVSRATLHNEDEIKRLDVRIGDTVVIQKAGDIIPDVVEVLKDLRTGKGKKFYFPKTFLGSAVVRKKSEVAHYVKDKSLTAIQLEQLYHFVSNKAFDIEGLGPKIIDQLMDKGLIKDGADIFSLTEEDLKPLERFADKSAKNLIKAIEQAKEIDLAKFLYALGIRHVGEETAIVLAEHVTGNKKQVTANNFIKTFNNLALEKLKEVQDIGPKVAQSIYNYFHNKKNIEFIERLFKNGVKIKSYPPATSKRSFDGRGQLQVTNYQLRNKIFVLTGELESLTRNEAKEKIRSLDAKTSSSVSKNTDYVVAGANPGSKLDKAQKLGVKIINEKEFLKIIS